MEPAYLIDGTRYPVVDKFRLGDPALVCEITGMEWRDFQNLLVDAAEDGFDLRIQSAMVAVAVSRVHPEWSRDKVVAFASRLDFDQVDVEGGREAAEEPDPTGAAGNDAESKQSTSSPLVNGSPESQSPPSPTGSGSPGSDTTSPALPLAV